jgi:hypothetical protein
VLANHITSAANMIKRTGGVIGWRIGPEPKSWDRRPDEGMRVDPDDDYGSIDPATWPTAQQFIDIQRRVNEANDQVKKAYAALSDLEKKAVQQPPRR